MLWHHLIPIPPSGTMLGCCYCTTKYVHFNRISVISYLILCKTIKSKCGIMLQRPVFWVKKLEQWDQATIVCNTSLVMCVLKLEGGKIINHQRGCLYVNEKSTYKWKHYVALVYKMLRYITMMSYVLRYEPLDTSINRKMDIYKMCCKSKKLLQGKKKLICFYESNGKLHPQLIKLNYKQGIERNKK
jgi:hypothetical protein